MRRKPRPAPAAGDVREVLRQAAAAHADGDPSYGLLETLFPAAVSRTIVYRWARNYQGRPIPAAELDHLEAEVLSRRPG